MKKQKILLIIMLIFNISLSSQITINGKVIDRDSQKPLSFANIKIADTFLGTVSGNDGSFSLQVKSLPVTLIISFIGYQTDTIVVNENQFLTIYLAPKSILTDEITVTAIRLDDNSPKNFTNLSIEKIQSLKTGQDLPLILNFTPSVVATSDAGNGVGYSDIRIRGTDITRINVTINGVPYNDPESQGVFWVDIPDIASSADNIQIQRGVGTSSFGTASFGASINILTGVMKNDPFVELQTNGGSFNTWGASAKFATGLIKDNWYLEGRLSHQYSDGYIDRAWYNLNSTYLSGGYYGKNIYLNKKLIEEKGVDFRQMQEVAIEFMLEFEGVQSAYRFSQLMNNGANPGTEMAKIRNSTYKNYAGDIILTLMPGWLEVDDRENPVGESNTLISKLPVWFYGAKIPQQRIVNQYQITDIAPTISSILNIPYPNANIGEAIKLTNN